MGRGRCQFMLVAAMATMLMFAQAEPRRRWARMFSYSTSIDTVGFIDLCLCVSLAAIFAAGLVLTVVGLVKHRKMLWIMGVVAMAASVAAGIALAGLMFALSGRSP